MNGKKKFRLCLILFQFVLFALVWLSYNGMSTVLAQAQTTTSASSDVLGLALGAGLSVGLCGLGAGIAVKTTGTAAISALTERDEAFFKAFLVVALGEALAIYGLIVAILLWQKIPLL